MEKKTITTVTEKGDPAVKPDSRPVSMHSREHSVWIPFFQTLVFSLLLTLWWPPLYTILWEVWGTSGFRGWLYNLALSWSMLYGIFAVGAFVASWRVWLFHTETMLGVDINNDGTIGPPPLGGGFVPFRRRPRTATATDIGAKDGNDFGEVLDE